MLGKATILFWLIANIVVAAYDLAKHYSDFPQLALLWFVLGLAGITIFAVSLWQHMRKGEITERIGGDLAMRALMGSFGFLLALGWMLRK
jgi:hypothetical protein